MKKVLLGILVLVLGLSWASGASAQENGRYLIKFKHGIPGNLESLVGNAGGIVERVHPQIGYAQVHTDDPGFAQRMEKQATVEAVYQDVRMQLESLFDRPAIRGPRQARQASTAPEDAALFPCQWHLRTIDAPGAWSQGALGSSTAKVAILDTGVDPNHIELEGRIDLEHSTSLLVTGSSACGADDEDSINDLAGHGTVMASLVSTNGINIASVAPDTEVVAVKIFNCQGQGEFSDIIAGLLYAADLPDVSAISMSLGGFIDRRDAGAKSIIHALRDAVDFAVAQGKIVVTVSGNQHLDIRNVRPLVGLPTESGQAIAVYATDVHDDLASYSNWGYPISWIGAPGGDNVPPDHPLAGCDAVPAEQQGRILGACSSFVCDGATDQYLTTRGTSVSTPLVAAVAALADGERDGAVSPRKLRILLRNRADDLGDHGIDEIFGVGRVNAARTVNH